VEEFTEDLLVQIAARPHEGKLEKAGHRRRQHVHRTPVVFDVDQHGAASEFVQHLGGRGRFELPDPRGLLGAERFDRQQGQQRSFAFVDEHREDLKEQFRRRRPLRKTVEPLGQLRVAGFECVVGHGRLNSRRCFRNRDDPSETADNGSPAGANR
jgi:hypothetical protein